MYDKNVNDMALRLHALTKARKDILDRKVGTDIRGGKNGPVDTVLTSLQQEMDQIVEVLNRLHL